MNTAEKLRFLADRAEDGTEFIFQDNVYYFNSVLLIRKIENQVDLTSETCNLGMNELRFGNLKLKPQWEFTEDEKVILSNVDKKYLWIVRESDNQLLLFTKKPNKNITGSLYHCAPESDYVIFKQFNHLFQSIQWEDKEPCEFRRYL